MLSQEGHMVAPLYHYTSQVFLSFGNSGSLEEWKNCHNVRHDWGLHPPPTTSYIHISHIQIVWDISMLSQWHMVAPLYHYTGQVAPRFGDSGSLEEWKCCHNLMVEADIHLRLLHTSILDIYKAFESLVCCLKGIWLHPYIITLAKLPPDLGIQVHLRSGNYAITSLLRLISILDHFIQPY